MTSKDLTLVHYWQPGTEADLPTILLLHGTGGNEHDLVDLGHALYSGASLLSPRGAVNENGASRFFRRLAEGIFDLEDLRKRTSDLAKFIADAAEVYGFDKKKVVAVGYSNGANIAASLLLSGMNSLAGAVLFHPMVPFEPDPLPSLKETDVFVGAGRHDAMVPEARTERLVELLSLAGAKVETHWELGGHNLNRAEIEAAKVWIKGDHKWN